MRVFFPACQYILTFSKAADNMIICGDQDISYVDAGNYKNRFNDLMTSITCAAEFDASSTTPQVW